MGVLLVSNGSTVTLSSRLWSWNSQGQVIGSAGSVVDIGGSDMLNPAYVWRTQRAVRTVVGFIANNIAQVPLHAFDRDVESGDRRRLLSSESRLAAVLGAPEDCATPFEMMHDLVVDRCLYDRYAALKMTDGESLQLLRLPPWRWKFKRDVTRRPQSLLWTRADGSVHEYELSKLLWLDGYRTDQESTPMEALVDLLTEQHESGKYRTVLWQKGGRMPGYITRPADAPPWSRVARDRFRTGWKKFAADGTREGETPLLEDGMEYHELQNAVTPRGAQQIEARKLSLAEVAAAFYLPAVFAGLLDSTSHSNVDAYREQLYSDVLGPDFQAIQQACNARLVPDLRTSETEYCEFNVAEKLRMSFDEQTRIYQTAVGGPIMTAAEARTRQNLPFIPGTDQLIQPLNVIVGGQASPTDSAPSPAKSAAIRAILAIPDSDPDPGTGGA